MVMIICIILLVLRSNNLEENKILYDLKVDEAHLITQEVILNTIESKIDHKKTLTGAIVVKPLALEL